MAKLRRQLAIAGIGLLAALSIVIVRLVFDARTAYRQGAAAEERGELVEAVRHYLDAGRAYVPGNPVVRRALDRLDAIGVAAVTKGDYATARAAFEAERAAMLGTRSFYTPFGERLPAVNRRLARLMAATEDPLGSPTFEQRTAWHEHRLAERLRPKTSVVLLALLGLGLWITCTVVFFRKGLDRNLGLVRAPAIFAGLGFLVGLGMFLVCLRLA
jgi:hypothetical protein